MQVLQNTQYINSIFKEGELERRQVCAKFAHTTRHGAIEGKIQRQEVMYYNLDVIISVGYRENSANRYNRALVNDGSDN